MKSNMNATEARVKQIISQIAGYGVDAKYIFKPEDVLDKKRPQKVIR